jgi:UDP-N-acetylmuramoyl-tripeptide--D-alanyl-D-alanine ligase
MSWLKLSEIAELAGGRLQGQDCAIESVCTDSRTILPKQLFVALQGERLDGHSFVRADMSAALVARPCPVDIPQILVEDTLAALGRLGQSWRQRQTLKLAALTGSNGKTTVKEMLSAILARAGMTLATQGNLNNHIGVPLTLLRLRDEHAYAVIEMGANHPGEIAYLTRLAMPDVALITNAGPAHLEGFGSLDGVVRAKGEIFEGLAEQGVAVINADDPACERWCSMAAGRRISRFGFSPQAEVRGMAYEAGTLTLQCALGRRKIALPLAGRHNALNALGAAAAALALGVGLDAVTDGLGAMQPVRGRLTPRQAVHGARLIDDSYNANPGSMRAAIEYLASLPRERWLVMGDMGELGGDAAQLHAEMGRLARERGIDRLYVMGPLSRAAAEAYGQDAQCFDAVESLTESLRQELTPEVTVLVKASRSMRLERVVEGLRLDATPATIADGH